MCACACVCVKPRSTHSHCTTGKVKHHVVLEEPGLQHHCLDLVVACQLSHNTMCHINAACPHHICHSTPGISKKLAESSTLNASRHKTKELRKQHPRRETTVSPVISNGNFLKGRLT